MVSFSGAEQFAEEYERNLRHTGLEVETQVSLSPLETLQLQVVLPTGGAPVEMIGQVVATHGGHAWMALAMTKDVESRLALAASEVVVGRSIYAPSAITRELRRPVTGRIDLCDVAPRFSGEIVRAFSADDLEDALVPRPVRAAAVARTSIVCLLRHIATRHLTGTLTVERAVEERGERKHVYFFSGAPSAVTSDPPRDSERLGQLLRNLGRIDEATLDRLLSVARDTGHRLGRVLVESKVIDQNELDSFLHYQVEVRLADLLSWPRADYRFEAGRDAGLEEEAHPVRAHAFLVRHCRRLVQEMSESDLEQALGVDLDRYGHLANAPRDDLLLDGMEREALPRLIEADRTLREIAGDHPLGRRRALRLLLLLIAAGCVETSDVRGTHAATGRPGGTA